MKKVKVRKNSEVHKILNLEDRHLPPRSNDQLQVPLNPCLIPKIRPPPNYRA